MEHLSIGETAKLLGVSVSTLRRWECEGKLLPAYRTVGGHRRYLWQDIQQFCGQFAPELRKTIAYARVSSHDQKDDLERQAQRLEQYCTEQRFERVEILKDLGSGLNYHKKQFKQLLRMIALGQVAHLILTHKDRLLRFGAEIIFQLCHIHQTNVTILEQDHELNLEKCLVTDVIELMTVFSARLHGSRSHKNKKQLKISTDMS